MWAEGRIPVVVQCRELLSATTSFADQLVKQLLQERGLSRLVFVGAPEQFAAYVTDSADRRSVTDRIEFLGAGAEMVVTAEAH